MKQLTIIIGIFLVGFGLSAQQQANYSSGLLFDDEVYQTLPKEKNEEGSKAMLPPRVDLKPFCPPVRNQGELFSCVGWAVGYGALTMQRAIQNRCTDPQIIAHNASSALFIYNQINNGNCSQGSRMSDALEFLKENGDCLAREFDFDVNDCEKQPDSLLETSAQNFAINDYSTLFAINEHPRNKVNKTRYALSQKKPVIIGLAVRRNFYQLQNATYWWPENGNTSPAGGHALVVIGYDDKRAAFQVMNSWGESWGDRGFIWIKYQDFGRFCKYAYVLYLDSKDQLSPNNQRNQVNAHVASKPLKTLGGNLDFRFVARRSQHSGAPFFENAKATFKGSHYELNRRDWKIGQLFQLFVEKNSKDQFIYAFSINQLGESKVHWPRIPNSKNQTSRNQISTKEFQQNSLLIPGQNKALKISKQGKEYLVVLFSKQKIEALPELINLLKRQKNNLPQALWNILGNKAVNKADINFEPNKMGFQVQTRDQGFIVPIILEVSTEAISKPQLRKPNAN